MGAIDISGGLVRAGDGVQGSVLAGLLGRPVDQQGLAVGRDVAFAQVFTVDQSAFPVSSKQLTLPVDKVDSGVQNGCRDVQQLHDPAQRHRVDQVLEDVPVLMGLMLALVGGTPERKDFLAGFALVPGGAKPVHAVFSAVEPANGLQSSAVQVRAAWDYGLQVVADAQELFGDGQIAVHRKDFAAQEALQRRLGLPCGHNGVIAGPWFPRRFILWPNPSFWGGTRRDSEVSTGRTLAVIDLNSSGGGWVPRPFERGLV